MLYIYIDKAKAYDKVCHSKLPMKMSKLEIGGNVLSGLAHTLLIDFKELW